MDETGDTGNQETERQLGELGRLLAEPPAPDPFPQPVDGLIAVVILMFAQFILSALLSPLGNLSSLLPGPAWSSPQVVVQFGASLCVLAFLWLQIAVARGARWRDAGIASRHPALDMLRGLGYALLAFILGLLATTFLIVAAETIASHLGAQPHTVEHFLQRQSRNEARTAHAVMNYLGIVLAVCVAPLVEELIFRGLLFRGLRRQWGFWPCATVSAALFTILHFYVVGAPMILIMGLVAAWTVERYRSITPAIFLHMAWNTRVFLVMHLVKG